MDPRPRTARPEEAAGLSRPAWDAQAERTALLNNPPALKAAEIPGKRVGANGSILRPRHGSTLEPAKKRIRKPGGTLAWWPISALSGAQSSARQKICALRLSFDQQTTHRDTLLIPSAGSSPRADRLGLPPCWSRCSPATGSPLDSGRFERGCGRYPAPASSLQHVEKPTPTLQQCRGFREELLEQRILILWCWNPAPWRTSRDGLPGPLRDRAGGGGGMGRRPRADEVGNLDHAIPDSRIPLGHSLPAEVTHTRRSLIQGFPGRPPGDALPMKPTCGFIACHANLDKEYFTAGRSSQTIRSVLSPRNRACTYPATLISPCRFARALSVSGTFRHTSATTTDHRFTQTRSL